ncbi:8-oxo-dGTP pyrophosphatase MutT, NUDIX family [Actinomadura madurae]|uniref:8-oxo-dGTP pyrophosphatase MutT, NUDIX family n=1 Tax=Actinomadura madurae TaxID=1993 RepID=A0A1I5W8S0_9ACTN|nr:NUDIX hydrolase [Actinomadura madurae]SFQ15656.1 8-oxo-dGTP pyrophosphatase MutT, NUDIX family [Actinomadura madurae]
MPSVEVGAAGPLTALSPIALQFAQKAFIVSGRRLLMVRKSAADPFHPGRWEVPGGRLEAEADLDLDDHVRREVWEEVGLKIDPGPPFHLWQWFMPGTGPGGGQIRVVAVARRCRPVTLDATLENQDGGDHLDGCAWVPLDEVGGYDLIPSLRPVMRAFLSPAG